MSDVVAYRLVKRKWRQIAFDGEGARLYGGRWNSRGHSCVYLAGSESLAILELMVHLDAYKLLQHYLLMQLRLPTESVLQLSSARLPDDWRDEPAPPSVAQIGDSWLDSMESLALAVPSVVVPRELNYIVNPAHTLFAETVATGVEIPFQPDVRL